MSKMKIIVGFPWVQACLRLGKLLPVDDFIPLYTTGEPGKSKINYYFKHKVRAFLIMLGPRRVFEIIQSGKERLLFQVS